MTTFQMPLIRENAAPGITLRDYQQEAHDAIVDYIRANPSGKPAVQIPTGGGKTVIFAKVAHTIGYPVLVLAHRDELLDQAAEKFRMVDPGVSVGKVKAETNQPWAEVVVASVQTLARDNRLAQMPKHYKLIIVDEAHHAPADSYQKILRHFHGTPVLGVSATLERGDGSGLGGVFDEIVYQKDMLWMIEQGYLSDLRSLQIQLADLNVDRVRMNAGRRDFADGALGDALHDAGAPGYALQAYLEHASERRGICFTPTVELAEEFAQVFNDGGVPAAAVSAKTPRGERQRIYEGLSKGDIRIVANAMVLTEGFDEPSVDVIIGARPTLSRSLFIQMVGRGLRLHPGKADCLYLDMVGNSDRVRLVTIPNLFELPTESMRDGGATLTQAVAAAQEQEQGEQQAMKLRDIEAIHVDLFTQRKFSWAKTTTSRGVEWVLSVPNGLVVLTPHPTDDGHELFDVVHRHRNGETVEVAHALDMGYAQGAAEDYVRKIGAEVLTSKEAAWRRKPASAKQIEALRRWNVQMIVREINGRTVAWLIDEPDDELTAGRASDLLTEKIARKSPRARKAAA